MSERGKHRLGSEELVRDKMGKWVMLVLLLVGAVGKWVATEEVLGRVHVGELDVVHW